MATLMQRLRKVNDRLQALPDKLGTPNYATVVLQIGTTQHLLTPRPKLEQIEPRQVQGFLSTSVQVALEDLWCTGINRDFTEEQLREAIYLLNATPNSQGIYLGQQSRAIWIDRSELMYYRVLLRVNRSR